MAFQVRPEQETEVLHYGDINLRAVHTPGHTEGATSWLLTYPESDSAQTVIFASSLSVNKGVQLVKNAKWSEITAAYQETFSRLKKLSATIFLTAHSNLFDLDKKRSQLKISSENPFVDDKALGDFVAKYEERFIRQLSNEKRSQ